MERGLPLQADHCRGLGPPSGGGEALFFLYLHTENSQTWFYNFNRESEVTQQKPTSHLQPLHKRGGQRPPGPSEGHTRLSFQSDLTSEGPADKVRNTEASLHDRKDGGCVSAWCGARPGCPPSHQPEQTNVMGPSDSVAGVTNARRQQNPQGKQTNKRNRHKKMTRWPVTCTKRGASQDIETSFPTPCSAAKHQS